MKKTKPKKTKLEVVKPNYNERSNKLKVEVVKSEFKVITAVYAKFQESAKTMRKNSIQAANFAREIGIHLRGISGHEQIKLDFWQDKCKGKLSFDYESAKIFVAVSHKMPRPADSMEEAAHFMQMVLVAADQLQLAERTEVQGRSTVSVVEKFFREFSLMRVPFAKITRNRPMEDWEPKALDTFIAETEWLEEARTTALKLRGAK
jgi:hypothetical protein